MRAMILAAGRGERMRPLTDTCPKPLLAAAGKPLIVRHVERLRDAGMREIVINHAHLGHLIEAALGNGDAFGVRLRYSPEPQALETAGGIRQALPLLGDAPFVVVNGDIHCDFDPARLIGRSADLSATTTLAHLVLVPNPAHHPDGDFGLADGRLRLGDRGRLTYSGIGLFHPALFEPVAAGTRAALGPLLRANIALDRIGGERHDGFWLDVGTPQRLAELERHLAAR